MGALTGSGIMVLMTMELVQNATTLQLSPYIVSFLADTIILLRYVEFDEELVTSLLVVKMRNSKHSKMARLCEITDNGLVVRESPREYRKRGTGQPEM